MPKTLNPSPQSESPFFNLLAEADEVQIREIPTDAPDRVMSSLEKTIKEFESNKDSQSLRTFFVHIKTPPAKIAATPKPAPGAKKYDVDGLRASAELLLENQDYLLARNLFSYLLQQNLRDPIGLRGLGICLYKLGEINSSRKCFRALTELYQSEEAHYWLGVGYQSESNDSQAVFHFERVLTPGLLTADQRFDLYKSHGNCLTRMGKLDQAEAKYLAALELSPTSDTIQVNFGTLMIQRREWKRAFAYFERGAELNPKSSKAQCGLGLSSLGMGLLAPAKQHFNLALDIDPTCLVALHQLIELAPETGDIPELKSRLRAYLERDPNHADNHFALGALLFKENNWKQADFHLGRALELRPGHAGATKLKADLKNLVRNGL